MDVAQEAQQDITGTRREACQDGGVKGKSGKQSGKPRLGGVFFVCVLRIEVFAVHQFRLERPLAPRVAVFFR
ncbi:hypothetical protein ALQ85_200157 [Pseudomonas syringae]|nr:hypothetical protein ALQ85_200157 [Pseudomonas syringae]